MRTPPGRQPRGTPALRGIAPGGSDPLQTKSKSFVETIKVIAQKIQNMLKYKLIYVSVNLCNEAIRELTDYTN